MNRKVGRALRSAPALRTTSPWIERICGNIWQQLFAAGDGAPALPNVLPTILIAAVLSLGGFGCETCYPSLTCGLWNRSTFRSFREPAENPRVTVYQSKTGRDFLVTYDEARESSDSIRRRAFYLEANLKRLQAGRKPHFSRPAQTNGLALLSLVPSSDGRTLTITNAAGRLTRAELPTYPAPCGEALRVLVTPLAVIADTAIAATVVGVFIAAASSGMTVSP